MGLEDPLYALLGADLTPIHGIGAYLALKMVGECGTERPRWANARPCTSWLGRAPGNTISGGQVRSARTRRSSNRAPVLLRLAAIKVGKTQSALGAFYRRLAARVGKAQAVTATARKLAVVFYTALRYGLHYSDPGASYYEQRYRERIVRNLTRRAQQLGYTLQPTPAGVS